MSKYIQQENQKLLWNVSQKIPSIQQIFPETRQQEEWFRNIIQHFYEQHKTESISKHRLTALNKETIQYMIESLKPHNNNSNSILKTGSGVFSGGKPPNVGGRSPVSTLAETFRKVSFESERTPNNSTRVETPLRGSLTGLRPSLLVTSSTPSVYDESTLRSDNLEGFKPHSDLASVNFSSSNSNFTELNNQLHITPRPNAPPTEHRGIPTKILEERQLEYDSMLKRELPTEPVFREFIEDKAIDNMEELIQQQLRLRELDVVFFPKGSTDTNTLDVNEKIAQPPPSAKHSGLVDRTKRSGVPDQLSEANRRIVQIKDILDSSVLVVNEELPDISKETVYEAEENKMIKMLLEIKEELRELKQFLNYQPPPELS